MAHMSRRAVKRFDPGVPRIRANLARVASRPGVIQVERKGDVVVLSGPVFENEAAALIRAAREAAAPLRIEDRLDVLSPKLAGRGSHQAENRLSYQPEFIQGSWPTAVRGFVGLSGGLLLARALRRRGWVDVLSSLLGTTLLARALLNTDITQLIGSFVLPVLRLKRTVFISAPVDAVYDFWRHFENYPRFMSHIEEVGVNDTSGLRWKARGPASRLLEWDTTVLSLQTNQKIAWKSVPGSLIATEGIVQMSPTQTGTQLRVELSYAPPVGAMGYLIAHALGFDPRDRIDQDLEVMRLLIERSERPS